MSDPVVESPADRGDVNSFCYRNYEVKYKLELSRFFKKLRVSYVAYCMLLLFLARGYLQTGWVSITALVLISVGYTIFRLYRPSSDPKRRRLARKLLLDSVDFLLVTALVYLTGGVQSYFLVAYTIPVLSTTVRYGPYYGFAYLLLAVALGCAASAFGSSFALPLMFYILSISGMLASAIWVVSTVSKYELRLREKLYTNSVTDQLTGLFHRGYGCERIREEIKRQEREEGRFSIVFIDLDNFKNFNDRYGHLVGDDILQHTAEVLRESIRGGETLARYGGDEFLLLLPGARKIEAAQALKRLRHAVYSKPYYLLSVPIRLGMSGGTAEYPSEGASLEQLLRVADWNMYHEKH